MPRTVASATPPNSCKAVLRGNRWHLDLARASAVGTLSATGRAAVPYAARDRAIVPLHGVVNGRCTCRRGDCTSPGKHPRTPHGVKGATTDENRNREWWGRWRDANVGIATGRPSGLVVVDIDPAHGGVDTIDGLVAERQDAGWLVTLTVHTGGGGFHLYFRHPGGAVSSSVGRLGPGVDVRGDGGLVVAPLSVHASGRRYHWAPEPGALLPLP